MNWEIGVSLQCMVLPIKQSNTDVVFQDWKYVFDLIFYLRAILKLFLIENYFCFDLLYVELQYIEYEHELLFKSQISDICLSKFVSVFATMYPLLVRQAWAPELLYCTLKQYIKTVHGITVTFFLCTPDVHYGEEYVMAVFQRKVIHKSLLHTVQLKHRIPNNE